MTNRPPQSADSPRCRSTPSISVIVPIYNKAKYLRECLQSVLTQTFGDFEIICVDDASTDGSAEILTDFVDRERRVRVYRNTVNLGPGASRNIGIDKSRGTYLQFTDADDLLPPNALAALYHLA